MTGSSKVAAATALLAAGLSATAALAEARWQEPFVQDCDLEPGGACNLEATCPEDAPWVVAGGGGFPQVEPEDNAIAMTMNLPINERTWRVRWRNMSGEDWAKGKFVVRIKCASTAEEAGW